LAQPIQNTLLKRRRSPRFKFPNLTGFGAERFHFGRHRQPRHPQFAALGALAKMGCFGSRELGRLIRRGVEDPLLECGAKLRHHALTCHQPSETDLYQNRV
jgi:hypothetical protein